MVVPLGPAASQKNKDSPEFLSGCLFCRAYAAGVKAADGVISNAASAQWQGRFQPAASSPFSAFARRRERLPPSLPGFVLLPAVVVRGHRHGGIKDARFIGKRRFRGNGHVDDIGPPHPEHAGFRLGGEAGAFDGDDGSGGMEREIVFAAAVDQDLAKRRQTVRPWAHGRAGPV